MLTAQRRVIPRRPPPDYPIGAWKQCLDIQQQVHIQHTRLPAVISFRESLLLIQQLQIAITVTSLLVVLSTGELESWAEFASPWLGTLLFKDDRYFFSNETAANKSYVERAAQRGQTLEVHIGIPAVIPFVIPPVNPALIQGMSTICTSATSNFADNQVKKTHKDPCCETYVISSVHPSVNPRPDHAHRTGWSHGPEYGVLRRCAHRAVFFLLLVTLVIVGSGCGSL